jgi:phosphoribosylglycinamide formyltransferase-1
MADKARLAVFISGSGTNLQSIMDRCADGTIPGEVVLVISNKQDAYGLLRAKKAGINTVVHRRKRFPDGKAADEHLLNLLVRHEIDIIALAGYLKMIPPPIVRKYRNRILNIHPALLPKYGGKGMYGHHVHEAVLASGDTESGVTIHLVDEVYDHGKVVAQEKVPVLPGDTPDDLAARVLAVEHELYPRVLKKLCAEIVKEKNL